MIIRHFNLLRKRIPAICQALLTFYILAFLLSVPACSQSPIGLSLTHNGLSSLTYNGVSFLAHGDVRVNRVILRDSSGRLSNANLQGASSVDQLRQQVSFNYAWGSVKVQYSVAGSRLNLTITTSNTSSSTVTGMFYEVMGLRFPGKVQEYDGSIPLIASNIGDPTTLSMSYGSGVVVLANEDVSKPLIVGFPWSFDKPANTVFPLRVNTDREGMYPDRVPYVDRPIAPGGSDVFELSLRFGPPGSSTASLAGDIYGKFAAAFPQQLQWNDRRAVGTLFLASSAIGSVTNPRGWFNDPSINVLTPAGIANLRTRVLAFADQSIAILKDMNAQGMVTWDIEGEQYPHATTYIGDPRIFATLAPEMAGIADEYFKKFRDAGMRVGVCIRPQQLTVSPDGRTAQQNEVADPAQLMISKIAYARDRWGATLFYVDSNGDPALPTNADVFRRVAAAFPDIVLMPEHENTQYYAYTAPYGELRGGVVRTPARARAIYPRAFSFINTSDGAIAQRYSDLITSVQQGDSLLYRSWWPEPANALVKNIYGQLPAVPVPTLSMTSPLAGGTLTGTVNFAAATSDNSRVARLQFTLDGRNVGNPVTRAPFTLLVDTKPFSNGAHTVSAVLTDMSGRTATANSIPVTINNAIAATCPPPSTNSFTGCYYGDQNFTNLKAVRVDNAIDFNWNSSSPDPSINRERFTARWQGYFTFDGSPYQFRARADDGIRIYVDGQVVLDGWRDQAPTTYTVTKPMAAGTHLVRVDYFQGILGSVAAVDWAKLGSSTSCPAPAVNAFTGCYYNDRNLSDLRLVRTDARINFNWGSGSPDQSIQPDHYSVRWQGDFNFEAANYRFNVTADDGVRIFVDDQLLIDGWRDQWPTNYSGQRALTPGLHRVRVEYYQGVISALIDVSWAKF